MSAWSPALFLLGRNILAALSDGQNLLEKISVLFFAVNSVAMQ